MNADDHELIERTRKLNKTLSMFVFALQEGADVPTDSQLGIADLLQALAETVRARAGRQAAGENGGSVVDRIRSEPRALAPARELEAGC